MKSTLKNRTVFTRDNLEVMRGMADKRVEPDLLRSAV